MDEPIIIRFYVEPLTLHKSSHCVNPMTLCSVFCNFHVKCQCLDHIITRPFVRPDHCFSTHMYCVCISKIINTYSVHLYKHIFVFLNFYLHSAFLLIEKIALSLTLHTSPIFLYIVINYRSIPLSWPVGVVKLWHKQLTT